MSAASDQPLTKNKKGAPMKFVILFASLVFAANVFANTESSTEQIKPVPKPSSITKPQPTKPVVVKPVVGETKPTVKPVVKPVAGETKPTVKPVVKPTPVQKQNLKTIIYGKTMADIEDSVINEIMLMKKGNYFHEKSGRKCNAVRNIQFGYSEAGSTYKVTKEGAVIASEKSFGWITFQCLTKKPIKK